MAVYIKGMSNISPQKTCDGTPLLSQPLTYATNRLTCVEPDYAAYIDAKQIRRMSRIIKMGIASATIALRAAGVQMPDAIITGTGYGCLEDTGIFLSKMIANNEDALNPTPFIQSTHNTIGSQIALLLQCQRYNQTYTQSALSFESALIDALLQLSEDGNRDILVGGIDETTDVSHGILERFGVFRKEVSNTLQLFEGTQSGTINGEGSAFFVLSGVKQPDSDVAIEAVRTFYKPDSQTLRSAMDDMISQASLSNKDIDLVLCGKSGNQKDDTVVYKLLRDALPFSENGVFKHLCGEYPVASAFACWLAAMILKNKQVPKIVTGKPSDRAIRNVLVFNQYFGIHYSLILLRAC